VIGLCRLSGRIWTWSVHRQPIKPMRPSDGLASSVRRPLRIQFEPPADPSAWHMTGRFNWPCPHQSYGTVPLCEWANDEGMRIWLPAQHKDLVVEFTYRVEGRWRKLAMRSRKLLAGIAASFRRRLQMNRWEPITANKTPASAIRTSATRTYAGTVGGCVLCHPTRAGD
jgi:2-polyprenyl-6-methoxyphenol hydroxylase-like FAD-dependent oxidoreductase